MRGLLFTIFVLLIVAGCAQQAPINTAAPSAESETVLTVGGIMPLTGDGAAYGLPVQRVAEYAREQVNRQWAAKGMHLEIVWEDGKCNGKDGLAAAQKLVNIDGVKVIYGAGCSGETLGAAPFAEANEVIMFSSVSSSPDVTNAGDYIFRNYPSDTAQVEALISFMEPRGYETAAILSENTDYAQALRQAYKAMLPSIHVNVVADEVADPETRDVRAQVTKIDTANPDVIIVLPQTIPVGGIFAKQLYEANIDADFIGDDVAVLDESLNEYATEFEGYYGLVGFWEKEETEEYQSMILATECEIGYYCATAHDALFLLAEILEVCGDGNTECIKERLYATQNWDGPLAGTISIDENGDVGGKFQVRQVKDGEMVTIE